LIIIDKYNINIIITIIIIIIY